MRLLWLILDLAVLSRTKQHYTVGCCKFAMHSNLGKYESNDSSFPTTHSVNWSTEVSKCFIHSSLRKPFQLTKLLPANKSIIFGNEKKKINLKVREMHTWVIYERS
jgi:hypothetical protein